MTATDTDYSLGLLEDEPEIGAPVTTELAPDPVPEAPASVTGMTLEEMSGTVTGFEHLAIAKMFGKDHDAIALYTYVFVWLRRTEELDDKAAYDKAMNVSSKDALAYFEEDDEITPDAPTTESGKG